MKLSRLLQIHDSAGLPPHCLPHVLGDPWLLQRNSYYAAVRNAIVVAGFDMRSCNSHLSADYFIAPLFQLDALLQAKQIPTPNNVETLRRLVRAGCDPDIKASELPHLVQTTSLAHESMHCHWHASLSMEAKGMGQVVLSILGEAFAHSAWPLLGCFAQNGPDHLFLRMAADLKVSKATTESLCRLGFPASQIPIQKTLSVLYFSTLVSPLLAKEEMLAVVDLALKIGTVGNDLRWREVLYELLSGEIKVNSGFQDVTQRVYFDANGSSEAFKSLKALGASGAITAYAELIAEALDIACVLQG